MYFPHSYPYFSNVSTPLYHPYDGRSTLHRMAELIHGTLQTEASAIELYRQLYETAPMEEKDSFRKIMEKKQAQLSHLLHLYVSLTGMQPEYRIEPVSFHDFRDGLQKAYELEARLLQELEQGADWSPYPQVRQLFVSAIAAVQENVELVRFLCQKAEKRQRDYGGQPFVINIEEAAVENNTFRTALWTGTHLQVTLMSIAVGEDIGLEIHPHTDQFLRIEEGEGIMQMGDSKEYLNFQQPVYDDFAIMVPAGKWHNVINTGNKPLKLYSIYAPPEHPFGTVHETKAEAEVAEHAYLF